MQLDLKKLPFGQYMSRHLLFEEADPMGRGWDKGLYLALAAGSNSMFGGFGLRSAGFIRLTPLAGGKEVAGTAEADPSQAVIRCEGGQTIALTLDTTLPRFYSRGFTVRGTKASYFGETDCIFIDKVHAESTTAPYSLAGDFMSLLGSVIEQTSPATSGFGLLGISRATSARQRASPLPNAARRSATSERHRARSQLQCGGNDERRHSTQVVARSHWQCKARVGVGSLP